MFASLVFYVHHQFNQQAFSSTAAPANSDQQPFSSIHLHLQLIFPGKKQRLHLLTAYPSIASQDQWLQEQELPAHLVDTSSSLLCYLQRSSNGS
jgi:hypothetical protein